MQCYLCKSAFFSHRKGQVRDAIDLKILECSECGLVTLSQLSHIQEGHYEHSGMHGVDTVPMVAWLKDTDWDDQRRFDMLTQMLLNKKVLDFGCGAGGFLIKANQLAASVEGVELELRVKQHWQDKLTIHADLEFVRQDYDLITAFHVIEHLPDPRALLQKLSGKLAARGRIVVEVPSSEDALLTLYDSDSFQHFTYWSQHLFLFNSETMRKLAAQAGLRIVSIQQYQRYPLSNHLHWLSQNKPGGHQKWSFLDSPELKSAYSNALAAIGKCDSLIAHLELIE